MIFYSFNQLNNFLIFIFSGFFVAIFNSVLEIIFLINSKKNLKNIVFRCIFYIFFAILFVFLLNLFNFGILNLSLLLAMIIGFIWQKKLDKNLVVFFKNKWYNVLTLKRKKHASKSKKS